MKSKSKAIEGRSSAPCSPSSATPRCDLLERTTLNPADWMALARMLENEAEFYKSALALVPVVDVKKLRKRLYELPATCSASWVSVNNPPTQAGQYVVGNTSHGYTGQARWMPRKAEWKFPAAQSAFRPDVWTVFPSLPNAEVRHGAKDADLD